MMNKSEQYTRNGNDIIIELIQLLTNIASFNFPCRVEPKATEEPLGMLTNGLNMLSEEVEKKTRENETLRESNHKLENFSYTLAHDIRSPLNNANGVLDLLGSEIKSGDYSNLDEYVEVLKSLNKNSLDMVNGLLEYSKATDKSTTQEKIDLKELCSSIVDGLSVVQPVSISYQIEVSYVRYNPTALYQILSNLINNAIKFNDKDKCQLVVSSTHRENDILISVQDNGPGIPEESKDTIYNLFFRLSRDDQMTGTGLGLAIIKTIVQENGGKVWTESSLGEGTIFHFTVPL
ncbi:hypothetical protein DN752_04770 [Echinicola strongylocentroti]|uniref:histidine kinase n=1 Tax=Echinicola strongylocentroti TaxID=1795355 RepID=A0A2Z4IEI6_9BACT|nr:HAMP domain-containing sensor histidine kinase [Echinicola strongylocentroti]AWW29501.1 hypothetical protein DN752_04770 [Echinicola strongylocentroti]